MTKSLSILKESYETDKTKTKKDNLPIVVTFMIMEGRKYEPFFITQIPIKYLTVDAAI